MKRIAATITILVLAGNAFAALSLQSIKIDSLQADGLTAVYNHATSTLTWSGGASITLYSSYDGTGDPVFYIDQNVNIHGVFTMMTDLSSGIVAKAQFAAVNWAVSIGGVNVIWGTHKAGELFIEEEQFEDFGGFIFDSGILFGSGVVHVEGCAFNAILADSCWEDDNGDARLKSLVLVDPSFNSYSTQSYNTFVTTMWLFADETVIPEPATMGLLGLGSLLVLRKRK